MSTTCAIAESRQQTFVSASSDNAPLLHAAIQPPSMRAHGNTWATILHAIMRCTSAKCTPHNSMMRMLCTACHTTLFNVQQVHASFCMSVPPAVKRTRRSPGPAHCDTPMMILHCMGSTTGLDHIKYAAAAASCNTPTRCCSLTHQPNMHTMKRLCLFHAACGAVSNIFHFSGVDLQLRRLHS